MAIGIIVPDRDTTPLKQAIQNKIPDVPVWVYPSIPDNSKVEMLVVWKQPKAILGAFPNLKLVSSLGAGVEHLLHDPHLPKGVPITRIVDPQLSLSMQRHVLLSVLHFHKRWGDYALQQSRQQWRVPQPPERKVRVGILGVGALGQAVGSYLLQAGFDVLGYSRTRKAQTIFPVWDAQSHALTAFAKQINVLVCLLPNTSQTQGILSASLFQALPVGSCLINVGRGVQLVESDLLQALEQGQLAQAYLDVFEQEPLPSSHPFWRHPQIFVTPHSASITDQQQAAKIIADNFRRLQLGQPLLFAVDRAVGY